MYSDATLTWDHQDDGVVTDAFYSDKGASVLVKSEQAMKEGDKIAFGFFGNKGVVNILPDDEMPMTEAGV